MLSTKTSKFTEDEFAGIEFVKTVAGVDEVGRGCVAGDVFAAAVILDNNKPIEGLKDSKKLSAKQREHLNSIIQDKAQAFAIATASIAEIDSMNILQASLLAMHRAVDALASKVDLVLVDGNRLPAWDYCSRAIIGGDDSVETIAASSIIAKVARDQYMMEMSVQFPDYGFEKHKGYLTKQHRKALKKMGYCALHRRSFEPIKSMSA